MAAPRGLGKGLDLMIPNLVGESKEKKEVPPVSTEKGGETIVKITKVEPNREQPRKLFDEDALQELADSIKQFGVIQPILVQTGDKHGNSAAVLQHRGKAAKKLSARYRSDFLGNPPSKGQWIKNRRAYQAI